MKIRHLSHLAICFVLLLAAVIWMRTQITLEAVPAPQPQGQVATAPVEDPDAAAKAREQAAYDAANQARINELNRLEAERQWRAKAAQQTKPVRESLRMSHQSAWTALISTNQQVFTNLLREAAHSKTGTAPCTICAGKGILDYCILCQNTGKCPACHGTGKVDNGDCCPSCMGSGKCYMCQGKGQMACPFCDDGMVYSKEPLPPRVIPVE